jgi:tetratricopeptide (TPR) repeat protein
VTERVFVDASVFLGFLTRDVERQYVRARELFQQAERGSLRLETTVLTLAELARTLERDCGMGRGETRDVLEAILDTRNLRVPLRQGWHGLFRRMHRRLAQNRRQKTCGQFPKREAHAAGRVRGVLRIGMGVLERIERYRSLMAVQTLEGCPAEGALTHIDDLAELAFGLRQIPGLQRALSLAEELHKQNLSPAQEARLHSVEALAWEKLRLLEAGGKKDALWHWEQPQVERELLHLRRALRRGPSLSPEFLARILSNTASLLNHVGRFSEAVEYWDMALAVAPRFQRVRGNRGYAFTQYARALYDPWHLELFLRRARTDLEAAVASDIPEEERHGFLERLRWIESRFRGGVPEGDLELFNHVEHYSEDEVRYRMWCLEHRLFLNPLNDLGSYPAAARDVLGVPPAVRSDRSGRGHYHGFFNQLKQAYVSARYLYYEGVSTRGPHFADRGVVLFDTRDYPSYSLAVEKVKASFTMAYSVFDKIAGFLALYLGLSAEGVTFRNVWYRARSVHEGLRDEFSTRKNWPLRGLFWLGKDFSEDAPGFRESLEPGGRQLSELRYHLERSYLKLHDDFPTFHETDVPPAAQADTLAYSLLRGEFEAKTLKLLKMARSALLYLSLAVHIEEHRRAADDPQGPPAVILDVWEDARKG